MKDYQEIIRRKTLDLLLRNVKSIDDLDLISYTITDYETDGYDFEEYKQKIKELRRGFWG